MNSALSFWDLTDEIPAEVHLAVPRGSRPPSIDYPPTHVHVFAAHTFELGRGRVRLERFLYRLCDRFVLKGGLLLTVLGVRRPTRDAGVLARGVTGDEESLLSVVREVASIEADDGMTFDASQARAMTIREHQDRRSGHPGHRPAAVAPGCKLRGPGAPKQS